MFAWFLALLALLFAPLPTAEPPLPVVYGSAPQPPAQTQTSNVFTQCAVLSQAGYHIWFPGQVAPYPLYADTAARRMVYVAPDGFVVLYKSWKNADGSTSTSSELRPLDSYCH